MNRDCLIEVTDVRTHRLDYELHVKEPVAVATVGYRVATTSLTSGTQIFDHIGHLTGQYRKLHILMWSTYIHLKLNVSLPCSGAVRLLPSGGSDVRLEEHVNQAANTVYCRNYQIPMWNDNDSTLDNITHLIYLSLIHI